MATLHFLYNRTGKLRSEHLFNVIKLMLHSVNFMLDLCCVNGIQKVYIYFIRQYLTGL